MSERIDDVLAREYPVRGDEAPELKPIREPDGVLRERTRGDRPERKRAECGTNELTACHTRV